MESYSVARLTVTNVDGKQLSPTIMSVILVHAILHNQSLGRRVLFINEFDHHMADQSQVDANRREPTLNTRNRTSHTLASSACVN